MKLIISLTILIMLFLLSKEYGCWTSTPSYAQLALPHLTPEEILRLELGQDLTSQTTLAAVCLLATGLKYIWGARQDKKVAALYKMRAEIEAMVSILRKTRHREAGDLMLEMMNQ